MAGVFLRVSSDSRYYHFLNPRKQGYMKNVLAVAFAMVLFGSGVLVGRNFPAHHFQPLHEGSTYLLDTSTGKVCEEVLQPATSGTTPDAATQYFNQLNSHSKTK